MQVSLYIMLKLIPQCRFHHDHRLCCNWFFSNTFMRVFLFFNTTNNGHFYDAWSLAKPTAQCARSTLKRGSSCITLHIEAGFIMYYAAHWSGVHHVLRCTLKRGSSCITLHIEAGFIMYYAVTDSHARAVGVHSHCVQQTDQPQRHYRNVATVQRHYRNVATVQRHYRNVATVQRHYRNVATVQRPYRNVATAQRTWPQYSDTTVTWPQYSDTTVTWPQYSDTTVTWPQHSERGHSTAKLP